MNFDAFKDPTFAYWMLVYVPMFLVAVVALEALQPPVVLIFLAGILFHIATDRVLDWFVEWYDVRQRNRSGEWSV